MIPYLHIVLVEPEIPENTGNVGRTCVALGCPLHLVGRLGFSLEEKRIRRSGLDYWPNLDVTHHATWEAFEKSLVDGARLYFLSTKGRRSVWETAFEKPCYLVFGSESRGLPPSFYKRFYDRLTRIPMRNGIRSLNLGTAVGVATYEAARQIQRSQGNVIVE